MPGNIHYDNKQELSWLLNMFHWNSLFFSDVFCVVFFNSICFGSASLLILTLQLIHSHCCLFLSCAFFVLTVKVFANCYPSISITAAPPTALGRDTLGPPWIHHLCLSIHLSMFPLIPLASPLHSFQTLHSPHGLAFVPTAFVFVFTSVTYRPFAPTLDMHILRPEHKKRNLTKETNRSK